VKVPGPAVSTVYGANSFASRRRRFRQGAGCRTDRSYRDHAEHVDDAHGIGIASRGIEAALLCGSRYICCPLCRAAQLRQ